MSDDREALLALAERVETGQIDDQLELLIQASDMIGKMPSRRERVGQFAEWLNFECMLDAGAFESAAMTLVPVGARWSFDNFDGPQGRPNAWIDTDEIREGNGATPALALVSAALRAHAGEQP